MQQQQSQLTPAQVQQQIQMQQQNILWNQKQQELTNTWNRENATQQQKIAHTQFMVEHIATPMMIVSLALILALVAAYVAKIRNAASIEVNRDDNANQAELKKLETAADVQKNRDDNEADVREARCLLEKRDEDAA